MCFVCLFRIGSLNVPFCQQGKRGGLMKMFQLLRQNEIQAIVGKPSISLQSRNGIDAVGRSGFQVGHKYFSISKRESLTDYQMLDYFILESGIRLSLLMAYGIKNSTYTSSCTL